MAKLKKISNKKAGVLLGGIACLLVVLDQLTKLWARNALANNDGVFIPGFIDFELLFNGGAAWGMFQGKSLMFIIIALVVIALVALYLVFSPEISVLESIALGLFVGGSVGNAIDRIAHGFVTDFIHTLFIDFPTFNLADCGIVVGVLLFFLALILTPNEKKLSKE